MHSSQNSSTYSRLSRELASKSEEFRLQIVNDDLLHWRGIISGPEDTPFQGGKFHIDIRVPQTYPYSAPKVVFLTKIFHPNVHFKTGEICLDILKTDWSPAWTLESLCRAISALMATPNPDSPLNCDAGNMLRAGDDRAYQSLAQCYTIEEAS